MSKKYTKAKTTLCDGVNNMSTVELTEDPDGFHGKSYKDFVAATEKCTCKEVKTYGMVCITCGKPYEMKTRFTMNGIAGVWNHGKES